MADAGLEPHWNPVLFADADRTWLFFKVGIYPKRWRTLVCTRDARGAWTPPRELVPGDEGGRGPVKNKLVVLSDGTWLAPASIEDDAGWRCFTDRSTDRGESWERGADVPPPPRGFAGRGIIQPSLWLSGPDAAHLLARSDEGWAFRSDSRDGGRTWSPARATTLPNNNSGLDLDRRPNGELILASNPLHDSFADRSPLVLDLGDPAGLRWRRVAVLEDAPGEFSYPAVLATPTGAVVAYTHQRRTIAVTWVVDPANRSG